MKVLVTGANGYVGAGICEYMERHGFEVVRTSRSAYDDRVRSMDITDREGTLTVIKREEPDIVVHAAALSSSGGCKRDPVLATRVNVDGTKNVVDAANSVNARLFHVSAATTVLGKTEYEKTKAISDDLVKYGSKSGYVILKPLVVFGLSPNTLTEKPFNQILRICVGNLKGISDSDRGFDNHWRFQPTWLEHMSEVVDALARRDDINDETIAIAVDMQSGALKTKYEIAKDVLLHFKKEGLPVPVCTDLRDDMRMDLSALHRLGLPVRTYNEMVSGIVTGIKDMNKKKKRSFA